MKILDMYSWLIANWLNGGILKNKKVNMESVIPTYSTIFTKGYYKSVYKIVGIKPDNFDMSFIDFIRDSMFEKFPDVEIDITMMHQPTSMPVSNDKYSRALAKAVNSYESYKEVYDSQGSVARLVGKTYRLTGGGSIRITKEKMESLHQIAASYTYVYEHITSGGSCSLVDIAIEMSSKSLRTLNKAESDLYGVMSSIGVYIVKMNGKLNSYLSKYSPASGPVRLFDKKLKPLLFTEENSTAWSTYKSRGLVGGGKNAILFGLDLRSRLPLSIDLFKTASAQVFMLLGQTGSGKTYAAFQIALSALARDEYVSAIDIKGREWSALTDFVDAKIITFDERNPVFVNTLRIDDLIDLDAEEAFNMAVRGTCNICMLALNLQGEGNTADAELVIREAVLKVYTMNNVDPKNKSTFANSRNISYKDILPVLNILEIATSYTEEQKSMVKLLRVRLNAFFGESGLFSNMFRREISLGEVMDSKFVIYEFNKNQGAMVDTLDVLRVAMLQFLDSKKKALLKSKGKFLFCFYEELQRCESFGNLLEYICSDVTGSRSNNAVIILLLNSLKVLQDKKGQDIRSNITSMVVGNVEKNDIDYIEDSFSNPWLASQLRLFASKQSVYRNCFAAYVRTGVEVIETIYKVELPDYISQKLKTRTTKEE